jgi:hypothetical protein
MVYPGATAMFATMLDIDGVRALIDAATGHTETRLARLVLRPAEGDQTWPDRPQETVYFGPMELVARVKDDQLTIRYERCRLVNLHTRLSQILGYLAP